MRVGIRADGGARVGLGHLGRCAALAQALEERGERAVFLGAPKECAPWLRARGFASAPWRPGPFALLIADSYRFTARDKRELRASARRLLVVDDLADYDGPCDWVLSTNLEAPGWSFPAPGARPLAGPGYHPMPREYWRAARPKRGGGPIRDLLISLGGGRSDGLVERVAAGARRALPNARLHVVLGAGDPLPERVESGMRFYRDLPTLKPLMERCQAAVSAGGLTLYELAFTGTPAVVVARAPNQRPNARGAARAGAAIFIGGAPGYSQARLAAALRRLSARPALRREMSAAGRRLIDGRGALRTIDAVLADAGRRLPALALRPMREGDVEWARRMRNRPELRKYFRRDAPISQASQRAWWRGLDRSICRLFIAWAGGERVGFAGLNSIDWKKGSAEFGIFITPEKQARGYGKRALEALLERGFEGLGLKTIHSCVLAYPGEDRWTFYKRAGFTKAPSSRQKVFYRKRGRRVRAIAFHMTRKTFEKARKSRSWNR